MCLCPSKKETDFGICRYSMFVAQKVHIDGLYRMLQGVWRSDQSLKVTS